MATLRPALAREPLPVTKISSVHKPVSPWVTRLSQGGNRPLPQCVIEMTGYARSSPLGDMPAAASVKIEISPHRDEHATDHPSQGLAVRWEAPSRLARLSR
jgi:hypothetical protein